MLQTVNAAHSQTRFLPSEMLSIVFQHACPAPDVSGKECIWTRPLHLDLRLVSTRWYDIVQSTPQLWTCAFLPKLCGNNIDIKAQFLKLCLDNSGSLPFTLYLEFHHKLDSGTSLLSSVVDETIEQNVYRVQILRLHRPPCSWLEHLIPKMSKLTTLHLVGPLPRPSCEYRCASVSVALRSIMDPIYFGYPLFRDLHSKPLIPSVTRLNLRSFPIDFSVKIFVACPNLIEFCSLGQAYPSEDNNPSTELTSPVTFIHLSSFAWSTARLNPVMLAWENHLLTNIRLPVLKTLDWSPYDTVIWNDSTIAFFSRLPQSVTTIQFCSITYHVTNVIFKPFRHLSGVSKIRFLDCSQILVEDVLSILSWTDKGDMLFPKLTDIHFKKSRFPSGTPVNLEAGRKLGQMLRSRIDVTNKFTFTVEKISLVSRWDDEVWRTLKELELDGLDLALIEDEHSLI